ncbi:MAG TPA: response regulator [Gemmataceae bacterium]
MNDSTPLASLRVLVADDEPDSAESLALILKLWGCQVRTAPNGVNALEVAHAFVPDVVLMDLGMPVLDGWAAARQLRDEPGMREALFVAVTGFGLRGDRRRSQEVGFDYHLVKPIDPVALLDILTRALGLEPAAHVGES